MSGKTYRHYGHFVGDPGLYREPGELEAWMERDPLILFRLLGGTGSSSRGSR